MSRVWLPTICQMLQSLAGLLRSVWWLQVCIDFATLKDAIYTRMFRIWFQVVDLHGWWWRLQPLSASLMSWAFQRYGFSSSLSLFMIQWGCLFPLSWATALPWHQFVVYVVVERLCKIVCYQPINHISIQPQERYAFMYSDHRTHIIVIGFTKMVLRELVMISTYESWWLALSSVVVKQNQLKKLVDWQVFN